MIRILFRLFRFRLALFNGISATGGYLLFPSAPKGIPMCATLIGALLLAAGGSALNQVIERDIDRLMVRTMNRPVPRGQLSPTTASLLGVFCVITGLMTLTIGASGDLLPALFGIISLLVYLGLYTPLKTRTPFALPVGAVCGALSPLIGWCVAGGSPVDHPVILLAGLLYLWQIPHFWLFQRRYTEDYQRAGIRMFDSIGERRYVGGHCRLWIFALAAGTMLLPAFGIIGRDVALWYALFLAPLIVLSLLRSESFLFSYLNLFPIMLTLALFVQK